MTSTSILAGSCLPSPACCRSSCRWPGLVEQRTRKLRLDRHGLDLRARRDRRRAALDAAARARFVVGPAMARGRRDPDLVAAARPAYRARARRAARRSALRQAVARLGRRRAAADVAARAEAGPRQHPAGACRSGLRRRIRCPGCARRIRRDCSFSRSAIGGEALADRQLRAFRRGNRTRAAICDVGLWSWSRHPNYFFEWFGWLAYPLIAIDLSGAYPGAGSRLPAGLHVLAAGACLRHPAA